MSGVKVERAFIAAVLYMYAQEYIADGISRFILERANDFMFE